MTLLLPDIPSIEMFKVMIFHFSIKKEDSHLKFVLFVFVKV